MQNNNLDDQLNQSNNDSQLPFWDKLYRKVFGDTFAGSIICPNKDLQRLCIDRVVILNDGKTILVEEKLREKDYSDILLEYLSVKEREKVGWAVNDDCIANYLVYGKKPTGDFYVFPFKELRNVAKAYKDKWGKEYNYIDAWNPKGKYTTQSIPVPVDVLKGVCTMRHYKIQISH